MGPSVAATAAEMHLSATRTWMSRARHHVRTEQAADQSACHDRSPGEGLMTKVERNRVRSPPCSRYSASVSLCGAFGDESGQVLRTLIAQSRGRRRRVAGA